MLSGYNCFYENLTPVKYTMKNDSFFFLLDIVEFNNYPKCLNYLTFVLSEKCN